VDRVGVLGEVENLPHFRGIRLGILRYLVVLSFVNGTADLCSRPQMPDRILVYGHKSAARGPTPSKTAESSSFRDTFLVLLSLSNGVNVGKFG